MFLYIDPGTGSMLFSILIGIVSTIFFLSRRLFLKLKFLINGGKTTSISDTKIPFVIFSDHKRYWNVFKPICDEFEKRGIQLVYYTASSDDPALSEKYNYVKAEFIGEGNKAFSKLNMMNAGICISTTPGLDVYQWKRSRNVDCYVHVPHTVDDLSGYRMFGLDFFDAVLTTGQNQIDLIRKIEALRPNIKTKELVTVGSPNLDLLKTRLDSINKRTENNKPVVLVAPSWGASGILSRYGDKLLSALVKADYKIIVRPHPQTLVSEQSILEPLVSKYTDIEWNFDNDNFEVLNNADIMITDFSGIIFDYSLVFDKPLIYADTSFDPAPYDAAFLDTEIWSLQVLPKLGIKLEEKDFSNIEEIIDNVINSKVLLDGRNEVRNQCWDSQGKAASNIVDYLINKKEEK